MGKIAKLADAMLYDMCEAAACGRTHCTTNYEGVEVFLCKNTNTKFFIESGSEFTCGDVSDALSALPSWYWAEAEAAQARRDANDMRATYDNIGWYN